MRDGDFRVRGKEISRVEGLSDAVFGFAITLLVVSLEVPKTGGEMLHAMRGFFAFTFTFGMLFGVWRTQFKFFRRYGLEDDFTVALNGILLFVILFFVYPLKFVIGAIAERLLAHAGFPDPAAPNFFTEPRAPLLMMIYALGLAAVFGVFALLYRHALLKHDELALTELEIFDTRQSLLAQAGTVVTSLSLAVIELVAYLRPHQSDREVIFISIPVIILVFLLVRKRRRGRAERKVLLAKQRGELVGA